MKSTSTITGAVPYTGDDWAQSMARRIAIPMLVMGIMAVAGGLVLGAVAGVGFGDFFAGSTVDDLGRAEALSQLSAATAFLGMGLILAGVVMSLVNIVRTLRDAGRDVQESLGASAYKLGKPGTARFTPVALMAGVMIELVAFGLGIYTAVTIGGVDPSAIADGSRASGADLADIGVVRAFSGWLPGLRLAGIAVLLVGVVLVLATIRSVLRLQAGRIRELVEAPSVDRQLATV